MSEIGMGLDPSFKSHCLRVKKMKEERDQNTNLKFKYCY